MLCWCLHPAPPICEERCLLWLLLWLLCRLWPNNICLLWLMCGQWPKNKRLLYGWQLKKKQDLSLCTQSKDTFNNISIQYQIEQLMNNNISFLFWLTTELFGFMMKELEIIIIFVWCGKVKNRSSSLPYCYHHWLSSICHHCHSIGSSSLLSQHCCFYYQRHQEVTKKKKILIYCASLPSITDPTLLWSLILRLTRFLLSSLKLCGVLWFNPI